MLICMSTIAACGSGDVDVTSPTMEVNTYSPEPTVDDVCGTQEPVVFNLTGGCLLYTSPSPRDATLSRMPSSA